MIEALVAIVVLSFGLLAIAGFQLRVLAATASASFGDQAARLASDMTERMRANPYAAGVPASSYYAVIGGWGRPAASGPADCAAVACDVWGIAQRDVWQWKTDVVLTLPEGDAAILDSGGTLRVLVTWKDNAEFVAPLGSDSGCPDTTETNKRSCLRLVVPKPPQS